MDSNIICKPSYATLVLKLKQNEKVKVESGAMLAMSSSAQIEGKMEGGLFKGLKRMFLSGESFFVTTITSSKDNTDVYLAPRFPGDIETLELDGNQEWIVQGGSFLASTEGITTDSTWSGLKGFFSGEGFFMIKATGQGRMWISSFGAIIEYNIPNGEKFIVDNGHIVAFPTSVNYEIKTAGGIVGSVKSGEGLICEYTGPGKIYIQSRNLQTFVEGLNPFMANKNLSGGEGGLLGRVFGG